MRFVLALPACLCGAECRPQGSSSKGAAAASLQQASHLVRVVDIIKARRPHWLSDLPAIIGSSTWRSVTSAGFKSRSPRRLLSDSAARSITRRHYDRSPHLFLRHRCISAEDVPCTGLARDKLFTTRLHLKTVRLGNDRIAPRTPMAVPPSVGSFRNESQRTDNVKAAKIAVL